MNDYAHYDEDAYSDEDAFSDEDDHSDEDYARFDDESFSIVNQVWPISGHKIQSLLIDQESLRFSSRRDKFAEEFEAAWQKKWTTATKLKIKYSSIRSITKEDGEMKMRIAYKTWIGIPSECEFNFFDTAVTAAFLTYMEKEQYFTSTHGRMLPFKAVSRWVLGLLFMILMTGLCLWLVVDRSHQDEHGDVKSQLFLYLLNLIGVKGVLAIGIGVCGYIVFKIWKRFSNPPNVVRLERL